MGRSAPQLIRGPEEPLERVEVVIEPRRGNWFASILPVYEAREAVRTVSNTFLYAGLNKKFSIWVISFHFSNKRYDLIFHFCISP